MKILFGQQLADSGTILFNAQLVIMDEPTSSISQNEIEMLYDFIRALKRRDAAPCAASLSVDKVRFPAQFHCSSYTRPSF